MGWAALGGRPAGVARPTRRLGPDSGAAFARLRRRDRVRRHRWWLWGSLSFAAAAVCLGLVLVSAPPACANPLGCRQQPRDTPAPAAPSPGRAAQSELQRAGIAHRAPHLRKIRRLPVPALRHVLPEHASAPDRRLRDDRQGAADPSRFSLPSHPYSRLAADYANAAGELGYYQAAATRIFEMQPVWAGDGDIDRALSPALPPAVMAKVRKLVEAPDPSLADDEAAARDDRLNQTPSIVLIYKGNRLVLGGALPYTK